MIGVGVHIYIIYNIYIYRFRYRYVCVPKKIESYFVIVLLVEFIN